MNATRWICIVAVAAAGTGFVSTVIANETELSSKGNYSSTDINSNSGAQLGAAGSATPDRSGDSASLPSSNNSAAQMGSGLNANPGAQLNNDTQTTSAPPVDSDANTPEQAITTPTAPGTK
jgi:hypothetical protein